MRNQLRVIKLFILPTILLISYVGFFLILRNVLPTPDQMIVAFSALYKKYGYEIIFLAAVAESLALVNLFVPGVITMALGAIFARTGEIELSWVILSAYLGTLLGYVLDFTLGYFGFAEIIRKFGYGQMLDRPKEQIKRFGAFGLILSFAYPNIGSFMSLVIGTIGWKFRDFLLICILSTAVWMSLWGLLIYTLGNVFLIILTKYSFLVFTVVVLALVLPYLVDKIEHPKI